MSTAIQQTTSLDLPGDMWYLYKEAKMYERAWVWTVDSASGWSFHFPVVTCIILSLLITIVLNTIFRR